MRPVTATDRPAHRVLARRGLRLQALARRPAHRARPRARVRAGRPTRTCSSASTPPTTPRSTASATTSRSSSPPTSSPRSSTTRSTGAASRRRTRSPTSTRWAAPRCSRSTSSAWPREGLPFELLARVLDGGAAAAAAAGCLIAGGHSIDDAEPKYGLAVVGTVDPDAVLTNAGARPGDVARADQADRPRRDLDRGEARQRDRRATSRPRST